MSTVLSSGLDLFIVKIILCYFQGDIIKKVIQSPSDFLSISLRIQLPCCDIAKLPHGEAACKCFNQQTYFGSQSIININYQTF